MRFKFDRDFYLPKHAAWTMCDFPDAQVTLYRYEAAGKFYAIAFYGKAQKPAFHYSFRTAERRQEYVDQMLAGRRSSMAHKAERKAKKAAFVHSLKVGDLLNTCWGYDQTNREFFEVTEVRGKSVIIREIAQDREETGFMCGDCVPLPGRYVGPPIRKLVLEGNSIKFESYRYAYFYERREIAPGVKVGTPVYWSSYA